MNQANSAKNQIREATEGITQISVSRYKSIYEECSIAVHPLTILAGANSSGKSSIMQPLLLLKQTLEATYDPGPLLLNGPNVQFTSTKQLLSKSPGKERTDSFSIQVNLSEESYFRDTFKQQPRKEIELIEMAYKSEQEQVILTPYMNHEDILRLFPLDLKNVLQTLTEDIKSQTEWIVGRNRCFLDFKLSWKSSKDDKLTVSSFFSIRLLNTFQTHIRKIIHVPGLRGNPERTYKTTAIGQEFPGTFENYVASVVNNWQITKDPHLQELANALETLGLTYAVEAKKFDDTQVELRVGRLPRRSKSKASDMVSIADVGFGVSQTLPVLVALLVAEPGQLVYLEQPEIHLHPRAQVAMAEILANAAKRGVKVVVETHSDKLILAIQSLVAEGNLSPDLVKLHWFTRQEDGITKVNSADLDETGAFGDWPEDFGDVSLQLENRYLSAAEARLMQGTHGG
jgi:predicted ATPase